MTLELSSGGSSGLLLRLFESSFFNVHLAIGYLKRNAPSIGITHYLVNRLRSFEPSEVEFYWAQLCYLLITRPTPSVALENFILERCELDPHIAVITLWIFQSSLSDLQLQPSTPQFNICRRVFNRVQSIIFTDPPNPTNLLSNEPSSILPSTPNSPSKISSLAPTKKINSTLATLVGMGAIGASIGLPTVATGSIGIMTIDQGYAVDNENQNMVRGGKDEDDEDDNSESGSETGSQILKPSLPPKGNNGKGLPASPSSSKGKKSQPNYLPGARLEPSPLPASNLASLLSRSSTSTRKSSTTTSPYLPTSIVSTKSKPPSATSSSTSSWKSTDPPIASPSSHRTRTARFDTLSLSVPSLPTATHSASYLPSPTRSSTLSNNTSLSIASSSPTTFPPEFLSRLLLLQSCRSQLDLLRSLQDISTRLVLVPKQARLSSLRAELTVLNHGLPRGCCLGMSCSGSSFASSSTSSSSPTSTSTTSKSHPHDRIVRISPSESAVLNSADRAPFVIHVEVLVGDLDFDPSRRQNAEDVRRALKERERSVGGGSGFELNGWKGRMSLESGLDNNGFSGTSTPNKSSIIHGGISNESDLSSGIAALGSLQSQDSKSKGEEVEIIHREIDMVEQLYGTVPIQEATMIDTLKEREDPSIQNREVDVLAWARIHDVEDLKGQDLADSTRPSTPFSPLLNPSSSSPQISQSNLLSPSPALASSTSSLRPSPTTRPTISLDQYAERMRMAAIMLSQLDASQAAAMSVVATGTAAAGTLVGLPVATVAGIGGVVGAGLAKLSAPFLRRDVQPGQASTGVHVSLDKESAAAGTSFVAGAPPLPSLPVSSLASSASSSTNATNPPNHNHRARLLTPLEASAIRNRIMDEMLILEEERMLRMKLDGNARSGWTTASGGGMEDGAVVMRAVNKDDPSGAVFRESFASKTSRIRAASPYGHLSSWNVISVIVKTGADLRQEQLAIQLIKEFGRIWKEENCPAWVRYFRILVTSEGSGLIETITDAVSIHSIKKDAYARTAADGTQVFTSFTLLDHYIESYGHASSAFRKAQKGFVSSLAAYSVICYLLQLKDRHNGNILVDRDGHLIHIDFGFMLSNSPGSLGFEMAPFKLPQEYIDVLGGFESENFAEFKSLFKRAFRAARKHAERIITLVELMQKDSNLPCFANGESTSQQLRERFQLSLTTSQVDEFVERLILSAATSSFTRLYDLFQGYSNGIL